MANPIPVLTAEEREVKKKDRLTKISNFIAENTQKSNYLKLIPIGQRWLFYKIYNGENSMKNAIKAKCLDCAQFDKDEIKTCHIVSCPLHNFRPYQVKAK